MRRRMAFWLQPRSMNSTASQSSSSGCVGRSPWRRVFAGFDNSVPEVLLPNAIHGHAAGQRIVPTHKPFGQSQAVFRQSFGPWIQSRRSAGVYGFAGAQVTASNAKLSRQVFGGGFVTHHQGGHDAERIELVLEALEIGPAGLEQGATLRNAAEKSDDLLGACGRAVRWQIPGATPREFERFRGARAHW